MAHITADRVKDTTTTTGTGSLTLANSAPTGFRTLNAVAATNDTFFYAVEGGAEWEVGLGTYSGSHVFARTTVLASSNSNAAVNFSAGTKNFFITLPSSKIADNTAYASSWDGETAVAPSKNAVYDKFEGFEHPGYIASNWYVANRDSVPAAGVALTSNTIYYNLFYIERRVTISDLGCHITTLAAGGNIKLAIYANNATTGRPTGTPLAETASMSTASAVTVSADITGSNVTLEPGFYWAALWADNSTVALRVTSRDTVHASTVMIGSATIGNLGASTGRCLMVLTSAEAYGTWPDATSETFTETTQPQTGVLLLMKAA